MAAEEKADFNPLVNDFIKSVTCWQSRGVHF